MGEIELWVENLSKSCVRGIRDELMGTYDILLGLHDTRLNE